MTSKGNKHKYANDEEKVSKVMLKKRCAFSDDDSSSSEKEVSLEEEPAR
jgi:hypothetical protein